MLVLKFFSDEVEQIWNDCINAGAEWDWNTFSPHITIGEKQETVDLEKIKFWNVGEDGFVHSSFPGVKIILGQIYDEDLDVGD